MAAGPHQQHRSSPQQDRVTGQAKALPHPQTQHLHPINCQTLGSRSQNHYLLATASPEASQLHQQKGYQLRRLLSAAFTSDTSPGLQYIAARLVEWGSIEGSGGGW